MTADIGSQQSELDQALSVTSGSEPDTTRRFSGGGARIFMVSIRGRLRAGRGQKRES